MLLISFILTIKKIFANFNFYCLARARITCARARVTCAYIRAYVRARGKMV